MNTAEVIEKLKTKFNPEAAQGKDLTFQFVVEGSQTYCLRVLEGTCDISTTEVDDADVTLTLSKETLDALINKELNAMTALMTGRLHIDGNMFLAMQLSQLFSI